MNKQEIIENLKGIKLGFLASKLYYNAEIIEKAIQSLTQEISAVSAEELELAESIIKKRYPFYDSNIDGKDIEINGKIAVELMQEYAQQTNAEAMKETFKYFFECGRNYQNNAEVTFKVAYQEYLNTLTTK